MLIVFWVLFGGKGPLCNDYFHMFFFCEVLVMGAGKLLKLTVKVLQIFQENDAGAVSLCLLLHV